MIIKLLLLLLVCVRASFIYNSRSRYHSSIRNSGFAHLNTIISKTHLNLVTQKREIDSLKKWSEEQGITRANGLQLIQEQRKQKKMENSDPLDDWSVLLTESMNEDDVILQVPKSLIFSSSSIHEQIEEIASKSEKVNMKAALEHLNQCKMEDINNKFFLWIKLLQETEQGQQSTWYPWIQSLPKSFTTGLSMDDVELECLPPHAYSLAQLLRYHHQIFTESLNLLITDNNNAENHSSTINVDKGEHTSEISSLFKNPQNMKNNHEIHEWAFNAIFTRCWDGGNNDYDLDLVPMGDMFNHGEPGNVLISYDDDHNCRVVLNQDVAAGTPLTLNYGRSTTPAKFLTIFGFVDESTPRIFCQILCEKPSQRHIDMGYDIDKMIFYTATDNNNDDMIISQAVWDVMLFNLLEQVPEKQEEFYQAHMKDDIFSKQKLHECYRMETAILLYRHVDSTAKELNLLLNKITQYDHTEHKRLPIILQHNSLIHKTFINVLQYLNIIIKNELKQRQKQ